MFRPMILLFHQELALSEQGLVRMRVELLHQLGQRFHSRLGCFREGRGVVPAWPLAHRLFCVAAILAAVRQKLHSSTLFGSPVPPCWAGRPKLLWLAMQPGKRTSCPESRRRAHPQSAGSLQPARQQRPVRTASLNNPYLASYL